jgi:hypothetical protein
MGTANGSGAGDNMAAWCVLKDAWF